MNLDMPEPRLGGYPVVNVLAVVIVAVLIHYQAQEMVLGFRK